jgi:hypothetical protein
MPSKTERLFNAIVILGASLVSGCSSGSDNPAPDNKGGSGDSGTPNFNVQKDASSSDAGWTGW